MIWKVSILGEGEEKNKKQIDREKDVNTDKQKTNKK